MLHSFLDYMICMCYCAALRFFSLDSIRYRDRHATLKRQSDGGVFFFIFAFEWISTGFRQLISLLCFDR